MATGPKPVPAMQRLRGKLEFVPGSCWLYRGTTDSHGYGRIRVGSLSDGTRKWELVHRLTYKSMCGPIPPDRELDHLCRVRHCARPSHLRIVTHRENLLAGRNANAEKRACPRCGGSYTENSSGGRICQACRNERARARRAAHA